MSASPWACAASLRSASVGVLERFALRAEGGVAQARTAVLEARRAVAEAPPPRRASPRTRRAVAGAAGRGRRGYRGDRRTCRRGRAGAASAFLLPGRSSPRTATTGLGAGFGAAAGAGAAASASLEMLLALLRHPAQLHALRDDPGLLDRALEESLRYAATDSGFGSPRYATQDVRVGEFLIPQGATVLVIRNAANRDPALVDDPESFDITRSPVQHFTFGFGPHVCLGAAVARLELSIVLSTVLRRHPEIALAVPFEDVPWEFRITAAGPAHVPVTW